MRMHSMSPGSVALWFHPDAFPSVMRWHEYIRQQDVFRESPENAKKSTDSSSAPFESKIERLRLTLCRVMTECQNPKDSKLHLTAKCYPATHPQPPRTAKTLF